MTAPSRTVRLTQFAAGGGCACKVPPGELEALLTGLDLDLPAAGDLLVGLDSGDDAAVVRLDGSRAVVSTADFFTPVVDDPFDWGRIAAANALSDVYAMGGEPLVAVNLLCWPRDVLPLELAADVLAGGLAVAREAVRDLPPFSWKWLRDPRARGQVLNDVCRRGGHVAWAAEHLYQRMRTVAG